MVTVHGPNTMYVSGAGGAGTPGTITNTGGSVSADLANARRFTFAGAGDRLAADYDWTFTGGAGAAAQPNIKSGTVTFTDDGPKVITLTLGTTGGTTPAGGTYTFNVVSGPGATPRMAAPPDEEEEVVGDDEEEIFDPADYTVAEVEEYATENPDQIEDLIEAEEAGKNRSTLIAWLEARLVEQ